LWLLKFVLYVAVFDHVQSKFRFWLSLIPFTKFGSEFSGVISVKPVNWFCPELTPNTERKAIFDVRS
jgi:hypothetical protein